MPQTTRRLPIVFVIALLFLAASPFADGRYFPSRSRSLSGTANHHRPLLAFASPSCRYRGARTACTKLATTTDIGSIASTDAQTADVAAKDDVVVDVHNVLSDALWNTNHIMRPEFWEREAPKDSHLRSFYEALLESVEMKPSTISGAGLGLFASQDLKAGSIVSLYPIHILGINFFEGGSEWVSLSEADQEYSLAVAEENGPNYSLYLLGNRKPEAEFDGTMIVDCNPDRPNVPGWMSHRINDGAIIEENSENGVLSYLKKSMAKQNCCISPWGPSPLLATFTTRDVKKGEELFTSYGISYWLEASFSGQEWAKKTDEIKEREKLLFECYLHYSMDGWYKKEADELQALFESF